MSRIGAGAATLQGRPVYPVLAAMALLLIALLVSLEDSGRFLNYQFSRPEVTEVVPRADAAWGDEEPSSAKKPLRACSAERAQRQVRLMPTLKINGCGSRPDGLYLRIVHMVDPDARVLVDIGSNKGYTGIQLLALWTSARVAPRRLHTVHKTGPYANLTDVVNCGMCNDCRDSIPTSQVSRSEAQSMGPLGLELWNKYRARNKSRAVGSRVLSFDGNAILVSALNSAIARLRVGEWWQAETSAFSDTYQVGKTIKFVVNNEFGHVRPTFYYVRLTRAADCRGRGATRDRSGCHGARGGSARADRGRNVPTQRRSTHQPAQD